MLQHSLAAEGQCGSSFPFSHSKLQGDCLNCIANSLLIHALIFVCPSLSFRSSRSINRRLFPVVAFRLSACLPPSAGLYQIELPWLPRIAAIVAPRPHQPTSQASPATIPSSHIRLASQLPPSSGEVPPGVAHGWQHHPVPPQAATPCTASGCSASHMMGHMMGHRGSTETTQVAPISGRGHFNP